MGGCVLYLLSSQHPPVQQEAQFHEKEGPVVYIFIILISEMGTPALAKAK